MAKSRQDRRNAKRFAEGMHAAGKLAYDLLNAVDAYIEPGMTTREVDLHVDMLTSAAGALSAPLNYGNFPAHCCISANEIVCHGIPGDRVLVEGDIVNVDVTPKLRGYHGDSSRMFCIGPVSPEAQKLVDVAKECLWKGIEAVSPGSTINVIGEAIQPHAEENGFSVVQQYTGHGIGKIFHKDPPVPHFVCALREGQEWPVLKTGMAFTIEPMLNTGSWEVGIQEDNWTVVTKDGSLSAQWEHTLLVTGQGIEVTTNG